jgi:hypothetical protein
MAHIPKGRERDIASRKRDDNPDREMLEKLLACRPLEWNDIADDPIVWLRIARIITVAADQTRTRHRRHKHC